MTQIIDVAALKSQLDDLRNKINKLEAENGTLRADLDKVGEGFVKVDVLVDIANALAPIYGHSTIAKVIRDVLENG
jgi:hypothetical protein